MLLDFDALAGSHRLLLEVELKPLQGSRFQPTGFPNLGAATYRGPAGTSMLLVESAQSVANRLEAACWDTLADDWIEPLKGVPMVKVYDKSSPLTNSVLEAHRLNSQYIKDSTWFSKFKSEIGYMENSSRSIDMRRYVFPAILKYDPNSLLHGFFFAEKSLGNIRSSRALSGFIEADQVETASSGGVKNDRVNASKTAETGGAKEGYGNVPFARDEYVSPSIKAYFNLDLAQVRGFGLGAAAETFLIAFALLKIGRFLTDGLRLRTACDLQVVKDIVVTRPSGFVFPSLSDLEAEMPELVSSVSGFATPPTTSVTWLAKKKRPTDETDAKLKSDAVDDVDTGAGDENQ